MECLFFSSQYSHGSHGVICERTQPCTIAHRICRPRMTFHSRNSWVHRGHSSTPERYVLHRIKPSSSVDLTMPLAAYSGHSIQHTTALKTHRHSAWGMPRLTPTVNTLSPKRPPGVLRSSKRRPRPPLLPSLAPGFTSTLPLVMVSGAFQKGWRFVTW